MVSYHSIKVEFSCDLVRDVARIREVRKESAEHRESARRLLGFYDLFNRKDAVVLLVLSNYVQDSRQTGRLITVSNLRCAIGQTFICQFCKGTPSEVPFNDWVACYMREVYSTPERIIHMFEPLCSRVGLLVPILYKFKNPAEVICVVLCCAKIECEYCNCYSIAFENRFRSFPVNAAASPHARLAAALRSASPGVWAKVGDFVAPFLVGYPGALQRVEGRVNLVDIF